MLTFANSVVYMFEPSRVEEKTWKKKEWNNNNDRDYSMLIRSAKKDY